MYVITADVKNRRDPAFYLPPYIKDALDGLGKDIYGSITEIRVKKGGAVTVYSDKLYYLSQDASLTQNAGKAIFTNQNDFFEMIDRMTKRSLYAAQNELRRGFLTLEGGHRVGVCGKTVCENGKVGQMTDISSVNIRIAREVKGCAEKIADAIEGKNTIIISPPACGKTTVLRDAARILSGKMIKVGIVDERGEIASVYKGEAQLDVGQNTDIYTNCPKSEGIMMLLRAMAPDVIITDEIGSQCDEEAIFASINAGVKIICSAHGYGAEDLKRRGVLRELIDNNIFEKYVVLSRRNGPGTVEKIY